MRLPSTNTLVECIAIGGLLCTGLAVTYKIQLSGKVKNANYFKDSMKLLLDHKASELLGEPITSGYIDVFSSKNYADKYKADIFVPVKGSKCKGEMFFSAVKEDNKWLVKRVELEFKDNMGGKVLVYDGNSENNEILGND